jgi:hypothetical protein
LKCFVASQTVERNEDLVFMRFKLERAFLRSTYCKSERYATATPFGARCSGYAIVLNVGHWKHTMDWITRVIRPKHPRPEIGAEDAKSGRMEAGENIGDRYSPFSCERR